MKKLVLRICVLLLALLFLSCACMQQGKEYLTVDDLDDECYELSGEAISKDDLRNIAGKAKDSTLEYLPIYLEKKGVRCPGSFENDFLPLVAKSNIYASEMIEVEGSDYVVLSCVFSQDFKTYYIECYFRGDEMLTPEYITLFGYFRDACRGIEYLSAGGKTWAVTTQEECHGTGFQSISTRWFCVDDRKMELEYRSKLVDATQHVPCGWEDFTSVVSEPVITEGKKGIFELCLPVEVELKIENNDVYMDPLKHTHVITLSYDPKTEAFCLKDAPLGFFIYQDDRFFYTNGTSTGFKYLLLQEEFESLPSDLDPNLQEVVDIYYESFTNTTEEG